MKSVNLVLVIAVLAACLAMMIGVALAAEESGEAKSKPKHTIKVVMNEAMKGGLMKKVAAGEASEEEKLHLLDLFISLVENEPPKGDMPSWHRLAGRVSLAAAKVVVGRDGAGAELKAAANCKACHDAHKGE